MPGCVPVLSLCVCVRVIILVLAMGTWMLLRLPWHADTQQGLLK